MFGEKCCIERIAGHERSFYELTANIKTQIKLENLDITKTGKHGAMNLCVPVNRRELPVKKMPAFKPIHTLLLSTTILTAISVQAFSQQAEVVGYQPNWTDAENWNTKRVPDSDTDVLIKGRTITSAGSAGAARNITLSEEGALIFQGKTAPEISAKAIAVLDKGELIFLDNPSSLKIDDEITVTKDGRVYFVGDSTAKSLRMRTLSEGLEPVSYQDYFQHMVSGTLVPLKPQIIFGGTSSASNSEITVERLTAQFGQNATADRAKLKVYGGGYIGLTDNASLGSATVESRDSFLLALDRSTLGASSIWIDEGSLLHLKEESNGGTALLYNEGGLVLLDGEGNLENAKLTNGIKGIVVFSEERQGESATISNEYGGTIQAGVRRKVPIEIGSLSGAGDFYLGNETLITGALEKDDVVTGVIHDGFSHSYRQLLNLGDDQFIEPEELSRTGLRKVGVGTLTLTGTNTYSRGTMIEAGTLQLGDGGTSGSIEGNIDNNAKLIFNRSDDVISANTISGSGEIVQAGPGSLLFTGDSSDFAGNTTVENGSLLVGKAGHGAVLGGSVTVLESARLGGFGVVGSGVGSLINISSGGTLAAGNSIGTLTIDGDLKLAPGSNLETEIANDGRSDLVNVTGKATLAGSGIRVVSVDADTSYQNERTYRILNADGGVDGVFSDLTVSSAFLHAGLAYTAKSVDLKIALSDDPGDLFQKVAETSNQLATATGLDTLAQSGLSLALYNDLLILNAHDARVSFDRLSGEAYASAAGFLVDQSHWVRDVMNSRMQQAFGVRATNDAQDTKPYFVWSNAYGAWGTHNGNSSSGDVKASIGGFVSGIDVEIDKWRIGIMAGYGRSSFDMNERISSGDSKNYTLGTYAASQWMLSETSAINFRSGLAHTWHDLSMNRDVSLPGFSDRLSSEYDASTLQLFGELGYQLKMGRTLFEPYANVGFLNFKSDEFGEDGTTAASLSVNSATMNTGFNTIGLRATTEFDIGETLVRARGDIGWRHSYGDVTPTSTASFLGSQAFTVSGAPIARDVALVEVGFDVHLTESAKLGVSYNGQFGHGAINNGANAKFSVKF